MKPIRTALVSSVLALSLFEASPSSAQITFDPGIFIQPTWKCRRWDLTACSSADLNNRAYHQVLVMPTGSADTDKAQFWADYETLIRQMSSAGTVWSTTKKASILYVGYFASGGALGTSTATFGGSILPGAVGGAALDVDPQAVAAKITDIRATLLPGLLPNAVALIFNDAGASPASATPRHFDQPYGIARLNRAHLTSPYAPTRQLATAMFGFLAESVTNGFQETSIRSLDVLSPSLKLSSGWDAIASMTNLTGIYDYNVSELLAANGNDNVSLSANPCTVPTPGFTPRPYEYEGGIGLGRGVWHCKGNNLLNDNTVMRAADDGFAYAHSLSQQAVIEEAFGSKPYRPNDRLRTAGPRNGWTSALGNTTHALIFDADKNHLTHPTLSYTVQVGWYERVWYAAWNGPFPYPAYQDEWKTMEKMVWATAQFIEIDPNASSGLMDFAQQLLCSVGVTRPATGSTVKMCAQKFSTASAIAPVPSIAIRSPYQEVDLPISGWNNTYWWRVSAWNGTFNSGYTAWSAIYRSL